MTEKVKVGLIGCGYIAPAYIKGCRTFPILDVVYCADRNPEAARRLADNCGLHPVSVSELLADPSIEIIINLTVPSAHSEVSLSIISAGKHVYSEKPLAVTRDDGRRILEAAEAAGVRVGCAPDTFLGGGFQTCRRLIDEGIIGTPVGTTAIMANHGPEGWHPNPHFYYQAGAGPLFDMGPYYLTALVHLLGPVERVTARSRAAFRERIATNVPPNKEVIQVNLDTHIVGLVDFVNGAVGTLMFSFDVWSHQLPYIEIYGTEGTINAPNPDTFGGPVLLWTQKDRSWRNIPLSHSDEVGRGIGVADLAYGLRYGRAHRTSGSIAYHILDVMHALTETSKLPEYHRVVSTCRQPIPLPVGLPAGTLDS